MPTTDTDLLREALRGALTRDARRGLAAVDTPDVWAQLVAHLAPVIGERGVEVLFGRAVHVASLKFPWSTTANDAGPPGAFAARLEAREASAVSEASEVVLATFTELLASLIGASLSERLLAPVRSSRNRASRLERGA